MGYIDESYATAARNGYEAIIRGTEILNSQITLNDICVGTGVGNYEHYLNRPKIQNDLHGMGAFVLMCTEYHKLVETRL